ncbi:ATP synthase subunit I [Tepidibacter thalassicus]|uniref:ATP synthase I chain n=1 Tax=Tepidibacter thalassicus DSM 15285 TaxID=1123350 RepID=A0A1M5R7U3_9FIRM|nr:ATP synthase subunit I [Tepidibacter thalassicus]SHH22089.1 ATP synthase I chain [Tepidibacter thalassicus DSM 15285]
MKSTLNTVLNISKIIVVLDILIVIFLFLTSSFSIEFLYGLVFGSIISILNLRLLSLTIEKAVTMSPGSAQGYVFSRYIIRLILSAIVLVVSFKAPYINPLATIIGLLMPKISIIFANLFGIDKIFRGKEA